MQETNQLYSSCRGLKHRGVTIVRSQYRPSQSIRCVSIAPQSFNSHPTMLRSIVLFSLALCAKAFEPLYINCGSRYSVDRNGVTWVGDKGYYSTGFSFFSWGYLFSSNDDVIFQTFRFTLSFLNQPLKYHVPVTAGKTYELTMYFAANLSGRQRSMDIYVEDDLLFDKLDIEATENGPRHTMVVSTIVNVLDDTINIELDSERYGPYISAIKVTEAKDPGATLPPTKAVTSAPVASPTSVATNTPVASPKSVATNAPVASPTSEVTTTAPIGSPPIAAPITEVTNAPVTSPTAEFTNAPAASQTSEAPVTQSGIIREFQLIDASLNTVIKKIENGETINLREYGSPNQLNVVAITESDEVRSVKFIESSRVERVVPYAYCGDHSADYYSCSDIKEGPNTVTATAMGRRRQELGSSSITFDLVDEPFLEMTEAPIVAPTKEPVMAPPIVAASASPSSQPSSRPSSSPTKMPTLAAKQPTGSPTVVQTRTATTTPTETATAQPTNSPTQVTTSSPTKTFTAAPIETATTTPTPVPTPIETTLAPTGRPTVAPSKDATTSPTVATTNSPTTSPTMVPTKATTASPTTMPTVAPTTDATASPIVAATKSPTTSPTMAPTKATTASPTSMPTAAPTRAATASPTVAATSEPTSSPTATPTKTPTAAPTRAATAPPTKSPTVAPTITTPVPTVPETAEPTIAVSTPAPASGRWLVTEADADLTNRHEACFVMIGDLAILAGGRYRGGNNVDIYDPTTRTWREGKSPPRELHHMQCVAVDGKLWIVSAWTGNYPFEKNAGEIFIYDPAADSWSTKPGLPEARQRGSTAVVVVESMRRIYVSHGNRGGHETGDHAETLGWLDYYDIDNETWVTGLPDAPNPRDHTGGSLVNGNKICISGGRDSGETNFFANLVYPTDCYDLNTNTWSVEADIPVGGAGGSYGTTCDGKLMIAGGEVPGRALSDVFVFDGSSWTTMPSLNIARHGSGLAVNCRCNQIYIASGAGSQGGSPELGSVETYFPNGADVQCPAL